MLSAVLPTAASAAPACQTSFAASYPPGWSQVSNTTTDWSTTDGNVIAADVAYTAGGPYLVIGGNFTLVHNKATGKDVPARNLAVLRISDGHVIWGASSMTGYPKAISFHAASNTIYVGGSFTEINGVARKAVAAFSATSYAMRPWAPVVDGGTIRSIQVSNAGSVFLAGNGSVAAFRASDAARLWTAPAANGVVRSLLLSPTQTELFAGGDFNRLAGAPANQLSKLAVSTGTPVPGFTSRLRPNSVPTAHDGELVLEMRWDAEGHLIVGRGGSTTNGLTSVAPWDGGHFWSHDTEGDTQALAVVGNTVAHGQHRSHGNTTTGCPFRFFGDQWANHDGTAFVLPWDPGLSGNPTLASVQSEANGGISDMVYEPQTRQLFVVGDFAKWGADCNYDTLVCTGGIPKRGVAVYKVL